MISNKTFVFHHLGFFENQNEFSANTAVQTITHLHTIWNHRNLIPRLKNTICTIMPSQE